MKTDIEISRETRLLPAAEVASRLGLDPEVIEPYGRFMAKVPASLIDDKAPLGRLVLVTAITPTKAGIGKTTVSVGLALGLNRIGRKAVVALREPSLGPCFGMKGGAAGGGYSQVLPMEKINLHFTGDFHAVTSANNMIAALLDNYLYQHRKEGFGLRRVFWRRVMDVNDRSLRSIVTGLGGPSNGLPAETGFDITPASEIMAILCLATGIEDLRRRVGNILLGITLDGKPFTVRDMGVEGAVVALLKDALDPNLVQTTENTPAFIHGGPFANIAHGCSSVIATRLSLQLADYVVTEAGFGADLGAEKFYDIKCRAAGLRPALTVIVATSQGLKMHGGVPLEGIAAPDAEGLRRGLANLDRHIANVRAFGQRVVVAFNRYASDTPEEIGLVREHCAAAGVPFAVNDAFARGGAGAEELARMVAGEAESGSARDLRFCYDITDPILEKIGKICRKVYGAASVRYDKAALQKLKMYSEAYPDGLCDRLPVCIAKTQFSFSADPTLYGVPEGFDIHIRDLILNAGSEMMVAVAGDIMRMPGLPRSPQAERIDVEGGEITGLS